MGKGSVDKMGKTRTRDLLALIR